MGDKSKRALLYAGLALVCYAVAFTTGSVGFAMIVFFVIGGISEMLFWLELFRAGRS